jgi:hypothetical protein
MIYCMKILWLDWILQSKKYETFCYAQKLSILRYRSDNVWILQFISKIKILTYLSHGLRAFKFNSSVSNIRLRNWPCISNLSCYSEKIMNLPSRNVNLLARDSINQTSSYPDVLMTHQLMDVWNESWKRKLFDRLFSSKIKEVVKNHKFWQSFDTKYKKARWMRLRFHKPFFLLKRAFQCENCQHL